MLLLQTIDTRWKDHLLGIDRLKEGVNLRAYAQKDPLIEYKKEAFKAFEQMNFNIKSEVIEKLMKIQLVDPNQALEMQHHGPDLDDMDYEGAEASQSFFERTPQPSAPAAAPMASPFGGAEPGPQEMEFGGPRGNDASKLNRAERRRMERKNKKRRR